MTPLTRAALARLPLPASAVEDIYRNPNASIRSLCESHERLRAELQGAEAMLESDRAEVGAVLRMLDELAQMWGDEGVFRTCRDRLRKLVAEDKEKP